MPDRSSKPADRPSKTRRAIRQAASELFLRDGYARTSMKAIAERAGVSEKTMYLVYETKARLLRDVIEVAVAGDENPGGLGQRRPWHDLIRASGEETVDRFAALNAELMARTAAVIALGESAAAGDAELAAYRDNAHDTARRNVQDLVRVLHHRGILASNVNERETVAALWALSTDETLYLRLTKECGWTDGGYAQLLGRLLRAALLTPQPGPAQRAPRPQPRSSARTRRRPGEADSAEAADQWHPAGSVETQQDKEADGIWTHPTT